MTTNIIQKELGQAMAPRYKEYALYTIGDRALPDVRSGCKPVSSRILYTMYEMGIKSNAPKKKCARITGQTAGLRHPHGLTSIYGNLVNMAQDWKTRYPLIDFQGNMGNRQGYAPAADRYTESRLSKYGEALLKDIEKNTVDFIPNYDDTETEPTTMSGLIPNLLANGSEGIACAMSTYIPPHNISELYNACLSMIDDVVNQKETTIPSLMQHIKGPDFPDGGLIVNNKDLSKIFETGKGRVTLRATYEIKEIKKNQCIWITELPYQVNQLTLTNKIDELASSGAIEGIKEVIDESDKNVGVRIAVYLKKDANVQMVINQLLKRTDMQKTINYNIMALISNKQPAQLGIKECLEYFLQHCMEVITRRTQFDYDKAYSRAHLIEGISLILHDIDNAIHIIRNSESPVTSLMETFALTKEQADYIYEMKIKSLSKQSEDKLLDEYNSLQVKIAEYTSILNDQNTLLNQMAKELTELRDKFGDERRTKIDLTASSDINEEDLIKDEALVITITSEGNIKSVEEKEYNTQKRGGKGSKAASTKDDEVVTDLFTVNSKDDLLFITNTGRCHTIKAYKLPKVSRTAKGKHLNNFLSLTESEYPVSTIATKLNDETVSLLFTTLKGKIKRLPVTHLSSRMSVTKVIGLAEDDAVVKAITAKEGDNVLVTTALGQGIRVEVSETCSKPIRPQGRSATGVSAIKCKEGDIVVGMTLIRDDSKIFTFTSNGLGKSTLGSEFAVKGRGGLGIKCHKITDKTGYLIGCLSLEEGHDIFVGTESGQIIRLKVEGLAVSGRDTSGTKLINLAKDDSVFTASLAPISKEEIEEEEDTQE